MKPPRPSGQALDIGYRHIDTAEMYENEAGVGQGIRDAGVDRGDVYITSKLNNGFHKPDDARRAFDGTLSELGFDYVDLFLIHWPLPTLYDGDFVSTWQTLEEFKRDGRARSIGVSNFQVAHLERLAKETDTVPAVNQIEVHPYFTNDEVRAYGQEHGIATEAWSPIAQGEVLDDQVVEGIADATGKSPAQVVLRWHIQRGDIVFPKSVTPERDQGELRDLRLRTEPGRRRRASPNWTRARRAAGAPTPTSSTTSPTDRQATLDYLVLFMPIVPLTGVVSGRYSSVRLSLILPRHEEDCMMKTGRLTRRVAASLGIAAIISMGALTACGSEEKEAPSETSTTTTTTTAPSAEPDREGAAARSGRTEPVLAVGDQRHLRRPPPPGDN